MAFQFHTPLARLKQAPHQSHRHAVAVGAGRSNDAATQSAPAPASLVAAAQHILAEAEAALKAEEGLLSRTEVLVAPLPAKDVGPLRGGQYPFTYDPVYGLPIIHKVLAYGEVLQSVRTGQVAEILWFRPAGDQSPAASSTRCLVHFVDGGVAQAMVPQTDLRLTQACSAAAVRMDILPLEPQERLGDGSASASPLVRWYRANAASLEHDSSLAGRGPRIAPLPEELAALDPELRTQMLDEEIELTQQAVAGLHRMSDEEWQQRQLLHSERYGRGGNRELTTTTAAEPRSMNFIEAWLRKRETQEMIMKWAPILGPVVGSAFIVALYMLVRLIRGDLTDRMKMVNQEAEKKKKQALKEARIAFLEEELPALVAKGQPFEAIKKRADDLNKRLGEKLAIAESEIQGAYEACQALLSEGVDLTGGEGSSSAASRMVAEAEAEVARANADAEGGAAEQPEDAMQEMGKLSTARIRKAVDPKILEVKRRVRNARRSLKRESKVQLSDEVIFFDDVAGNEQAKVELMEVVDFFRRPERFRASGARAPKGVLLVGPPGNGKTLMARAVAGESGVAFISSSAAEFIEMYMGLGAARVRDLFNTARNLAPCIIFIDELDAVGRARASSAKANDERDTTVNQLLTEMDGFVAEQQGIVVMAATNRKDVLDAALTRPGRFDRSIEVRRPDFKGRLEGIKVHLSGKPIAPDLDYRQLAMVTGGMSGAQLAGVCNTACFIAARAGRTEVTQQDLIQAAEQQKYGRSYDPNRRVTEERRRRFAVMEAAISLTCTLMPAIEPVDYVTIAPSVKSPVGRTVLKHNVGRATTGVWTKRYMQEQLLVMLAGRAGEELVFGLDGLSSLNQSRIMFARQIVLRMLNSGFSEHPDYENIRTLGATYYDDSWEPYRLQRTTVTTDANQTRSEGIDVDIEMERMLNDGYKRVKELLERNKEAMDALVELLCEKEQVSGDEVRAVVERYAAQEDLQKRAADKQLALL